MLSRGVLLLLFGFVGFLTAFSFFSSSSSSSSSRNSGNLPIAPKNEAKEKQARNGNKSTGSLKLCPPGGQSFLDAMSLICTMRRRKRSISMDYGNIGDLEEVMKTCCYTGCDFSDLFSICRDPFG